MNDLELLRNYRETGSEEAFRELVEHHLGMVYAVALRQVRNPDWADEVAHAVFIALARKAGSLSERTVLAGWLYRATRFARVNSCGTRNAAPATKRRLPWLT